eukprot:50008_1
MSTSAKNSCVIIVIIIMLSASFLLCVQVFYNRSFNGGSILDSTLQVNDTKQTQISSTSSVFGFYQHPQQFITKLSKCLLSDNCHIYFNHIAKTGGTTIETVLFSMCPPPTNRIQHSCCGQKMMANFRAHKNEFCSAKFTAYQLPNLYTNHSYFEEIITTCMKMENITAIALISYREPIVRALSHINQICNKNHDSRKEVIQACKNCSYKHNKNFWDKYISLFNIVYKNIYDDIQMIQQMNNIDVLIIENIDLAKMFNDLNKVISNVTIPSNVRKNQENTSICNFGLKSTLVKQLSDSLKLYRYLISL